MSGLVALLREVWPRLWEAIVALVSYWKGQADAEREEELEEVKYDAAAYRRVLGAPRADGLSDDELMSELQRRGLWRMAGKSPNRD